jgi:hypothetical protein
MDEPDPDIDKAANPGRHALARSLADAYRMRSDEALAWCDAWVAYAARSGLPSGARYFWYSARGWIDAQLAFARTESMRASAGSEIGRHTPGR